MNQGEPVNDVPTPPPEPPASTPAPQPPPSTPQPVPPTAAAPPAGAAPGPVVPKPDKSGKAVAAMVLGIVALVSLLCGWIFLELPSLILGILAIVFGHLGKKETAERPGLEGEGQAQAGFIMGIVATALAAIWFVFIVIAAATS